MADATPFALSCFCCFIIFMICCFLSSLFTGKPPKIDRDDGHWHDNDHKERP